MRNKLVDKQEVIDKLKLLTDEKRHSMKAVEEETGIDYGRLRNIKKGLIDKIYPFELKAIDNFISRLNSNFSVNDELLGRTMREKEKAINKAKEVTKKLQSLLVRLSEIEEEVKEIKAENESLKAENDSLLLENKTLHDALKNSKD